MRRAALPIAALTLAASACSSAPASAPALAPAAPVAPTPAASLAPTPAPSSTWSPVTQSPWPLEPAGDPRETALAATCGEPDGALTRVARDLVALRARGLGAPDAEELLAKLRAAGQPYVRPRVVVATGHAPIDDALLETELARTKIAKTPIRCGVAIAPTPHGGEVLLVLRAEALADLSPLPTRARTGEWLTFDAHVRVAARSAKLVVLGPRGAPHTVPTSLDPSTGRARARFALEQPGAFTVQLVGDLAEGPRPLLEARVFADIPPTPPGEEPPAPGEDDPGAIAAGEIPNGDAPALRRMVAAMRIEEGSPALAPDDQLDALARAHAEHMRDRRSVAHDLGDGDFKDRFEAGSTLDARAVGENVAHAPTVALAHRALYASPSHRINLLRADYTHMGIGIARASDGSVYVCETFAATTTRAAKN